MQLTVLVVKKCLKASPWPHMHDVNYDVLKTHKERDVRAGIGRSYSNEASPLVIFHGQGWGRPTANSFASLFLFFFKRYLVKTSEGRERYKPTQEAGKAGYPFSKSNSVFALSWELDASQQAKSLDCQFVNDRKKYHLFPSSRNTVR